MPALNARLQVARLAEAAGDSVPYLESVAKVAVLVFRLLDQKAKNKESAKELCESIANTIIVIETLVRIQGEQESTQRSGYRHLQGTAQDMTDMKLKHRGIKGVFCIDDFRDTIQAYRRRVDDLKTDALIHSLGDCCLEVMQMHWPVTDVVAQVVHAVFLNERQHAVPRCESTARKGVRTSSSQSGKYAYQEVNLQVINVFPITLYGVSKVVDFEEALDPVVFPLRVFQIVGYASQISAG
ncbi:uncharacterized protein ARMOST_06163 [Armillaria ostoyae]|uniref:Uncharacterized protein n=1 Tax=Armillaria ostoyae TaxID=47428 RepID=A0A284R2A3_ARMOS|nr:uncharacterized protein ARMOST_06163 [Armillaria ostoyae]